MTTSTEPEVIPVSEPAQVAPEVSDKIIMPDFNTDPEAFTKKFDELPFEQRLKIEQGQFDIEQKKEAVVDKVVDRLPGDAPIPEKELGWDEEELLKMDPHTQKSIQAMNERLEQYSKYDSEEFKSIQELIENDTVIKNRLQEIQEGKKYKAPDEIKTGFDPNKIVTQQDLFKLNSIENQDEYAKELVKLLNKAYNSGVDETFGYADVKANQEVINARKQSEYEKQLGSLMEKNKIESKLPFTHPEHPMRAYIDWVADSGITQQFIDGLGENAAEALYASYMVKNGGLNKMIDNAVKSKNNNFIRKMTEARDSLKTLSRTEQTNSSFQGNPYGIDEEKFMKDPVYAQQVFLAQPYEVRKKLEQFSITGKFPK